MNEYRSVRDYALGLEAGQSDHGKICPKCGGGASRDKAFSITRLTNGDVAFHCHRAKCGFRGYLRAYASERVRAKSFTPRLFTADVRPLGDKELNYLSDRFGLDRALAVDVGEWTYSDQMERYLFPVYSRYGERRGLVARSYRPDVRPKVDTYREVEGPFISWYPAGGRYEAILAVEDIVSAVKASPFFRTVALGGTHISDVMAAEIVEEAQGKPILIALDKDATALGIKWANKYALWGNFMAWPLSKDIKDQSFDDIWKITYASA